MGQRYVFDHSKPLGQKLVPIEQAPARLLYGSGMQIIPDIEPHVSPVTGEVIGSRSKRREHMRQHGLEEMGNERPRPHRTPRMAPAAPEMARIFKEKGLMG